MVRNGWFDGGCAQAAGSRPKRIAGWGLAAKRRTRPGTPGRNGSIPTRNWEMTRIERHFNAKSQSRKVAKKDITLCSLAPLRLCVKHPRAIPDKILTGMADSDMLQRKMESQFVQFCALWRPKFVADAGQAGLASRRRAECVIFTHCSALPFLFFEPQTQPKKQTPIKAEIKAN
jgi:hypothetical protein